MADAAAVVVAVVVAVVAVAPEWARDVVGVDDAGRGGDGK